MTYLARAHLVKGDECKCLGQHGDRKVLLGNQQRYQESREEQLGNEGERLKPRGRRLWVGGVEIEEDVVGAEVVSVVDPSQMVQIGMYDKGGAVSYPSVSCVLT